MCQQGARCSRDRPTPDPADHPLRRHVDPDGRGRRFILPRGAKREPGRGFPIEAGREGREHRPASRDPEADGVGHTVHRLAAAGDAIRADDQGVDDDEQAQCGDRRHGRGELSDHQAGDRGHRGHRGHGQEQSRREAELSLPDRLREVRHQRRLDHGRQGQGGRNLGAQRHEGDMAEAQDPGIAGEDRERHHRDDHDHVVRDRRRARGGTRERREDGNDEERGAERQTARGSRLGNRSRDGPSHDHSGHCRENTRRPRGRSNHLLQC